MKVAKKMKLRTVPAGTAPWSLQWDATLEGEEWVLTHGYTGEVVTAPFMVLDDQGNFMMEDLGDS